MVIVIVKIIVIFMLIIIVIVIVIIKIIVIVIIKIIVIFMTIVTIIPLRCQRPMQQRRWTDTDDGLSNSYWKEGEGRMRRKISLCTIFTFC